MTFLSAVFAPNLTIWWVLAESVTSTWNLFNKDRFPCKFEACPCINSFLHVGSVHRIGSTYVRTSISCMLCTSCMTVTRSHLRRNKLLWHFTPRLSLHLTIVPFVKIFSPQTVLIILHVYKFLQNMFSGARRFMTPRNDVINDETWASCAHLTSAESFSIAEMGFISFQPET